MKQKYLKPQTEILKIAALQLMAGSESMDTKGDFGDGSGISLGSRGGRWEDDED